MAHKFLAAPAALIFALRAYIAHPSRESLKLSVVYGTHHLLITANKLSTVQVTVEEVVHTCSKGRDKQKKETLLLAHFLIETQRPPTLGVLKDLNKGSTLQGHEVLNWVCAFMAQLGCEFVTVQDASVIRDSNVPDCLSFYSYQLMRCLRTGKGMYEANGFTLCEDPQRYQSQTTYQWAIQHLQSTSLEWLLQTHPGTHHEGENYASNIRANCATQRIRPSDETLHTYVTKLHRFKGERSLSPEDFHRYLVNLDHLIRPSKIFFQPTGEVDPPFTLFRIALLFLDSSEHFSKALSPQTNATFTPCVTPEQLSLFLSKAAYTRFTDEERHECLDNLFFSSPGTFAPTPSDPLLI